MIIHFDSNWLFSKKGNAASNFILFCFLFTAIFGHFLVMTKVLAKDCGNSGEKIDNIFGISLKLNFDEFKKKHSEFECGKPYSNLFPNQPHRAQSIDCTTDGGKFEVSFVQDKELDKFVITNVSKRGLTGSLVEAKKGIDKKLNCDSKIQKVTYKDEYWYAISEKFYDGEIGASTERKIILPSHLNIKAEEPQDLPAPGIGYHNGELRTWHSEKNERMVEENQKSKLKEKIPDL